MMSPTSDSSTSDGPQNSRNNVALGVIGGAFVGVMALTAPFVATQLRSSLPYMATPRSKVDRALRFVSRRLEASNHKNALTLKPAQLSIKRNRKFNFLDLGSGDGTTILAAASLGWNATGLELNPTLWFISSLRRLVLFPRISRTNSQLLLGDMFKNEIARQRLQGADCVMIFGVQQLMPKIADLVQRECTPGCFLMSYRFRVPLLADRKKSAGKKDGSVNNEKDDSSEASSFGSGINATLVYDKEEMRIYELDK